jgi:hypothetical protein
MCLSALTQIICSKPTKLPAFQLHSKGITPVALSQIRVPVTAAVAV